MKISGHRICIPEASVDDTKHIFQIFLLLSAISSCFILFKSLLIIGGEGLFLFLFVWGLVLFSWGRVSLKNSPEKPGWSQIHRNLSA